MNYDLSHLTQDQRDAVRIVDAIGTAIALAGMFPVSALKLATQTLAANNFSNDEREREVVKCFIRYMEDQFD